MRELLYELWNLEIRVMPICLLLFLFHAPTRLRQFLKSAYTPIYFGIPPFNSLNDMLAKYYNTGFYEGESLPVKELQRKALISTFLDMTVIPLLTGMASGMILTSEMLRQAAFALGIMLVIKATRAWFEFKNSEFATTSRLICLGIIYASYCFGSVYLVNTGFKLVHNPSKVIDLVRDSWKGLVDRLLLQPLFQAYFLDELFNASKRSISTVHHITRGKNDGARKL